MLAGNDSTGIYVYDPDNVSITAKPSAIDVASRIFQIPDGLAYMYKNGAVMRTVNCEEHAPFTV